MADVEVTVDSKPIATESVAVAVTFALRPITVELVASLVLPEPTVTVLALVVLMSLPIVTELDAEFEVTFEPIVTAFTPPVILASTPITTALFAGLF